ncbi:VF530 family protein [uncultured Flavobacterium sp.]|uniref:VF530 family protein n=1 Tax=uncultured Flavobacterium sp. TaxID=165435 RepID=UPI0030EE165D|tara:strand:- start:17685 stop:17891 length:207 start_codon:yes stop_codon:yes gene_type:complete
MNKDTLHGIKLVDILEKLVADYGFEILGEKINIKCFTSNPTIKSSLTFLRKTPWAREKVEQLYLKSIK